MTTARISIKPVASHHGWFLLLSGVVLLLLGLLAAQQFWHQARLVLIFCLLLALVVIFIGIVKINEPEVSFILTPEEMVFCHRYGRWQLTWSNIGYIGPLRQNSWFSETQLPYLGIVLKDLQPLLNHISPRLASRLMHEQRPLLLYCISQGLLDSEQSVINFTPFKFNDGTLVTGPVAGFLHQSALLHQALGFHLYLPQSALDRDTEAFAQLLNQCKRAAPHYHDAI